MNTATVPQLKNEIKHLEKGELIELCLKLAKFKKENKELLSYLLFEADDEAHFIETIKDDITDEFENINRSSAYLIKKSSRRLSQNVVLGNMYRTQVGVIKKAMAKVHEDLQYDYADALDSLMDHPEYY